MMGEDRDAFAEELRREGIFLLDERMLRLYQQKYRDWPLLVEALRLLPVRYNELHAQINRLERSGRIFVIRPRGPVQVSRVEKDVGKLKALYEEGRHMAEERLPAMLEYLNK